MSQLSRLSTRAWLLVLVCTVSFVAWSDFARMQRVDYITGLASESSVTVDSHSPTGYAGGVRNLIVPEHNNESYEWIAQTQQMLARGDWRVRHVDYDNAPFGRGVDLASPFRWWLGLVASLHHWITDQPLGLSVERAALFAGPLFHLLLLLITTAYTARRFGLASACLVSVGIGLLFPFAGAFLPGQPEDDSFAQACIVWSLLPLLAGVRRASPVQGPEGEPAGPSIGSPPLFDFGLAGIVGGLGVWIAPNIGLPLVGAIFLSGLLMIGFTRRDQARGLRETSPQLPWNHWALCGALTILVGYSLEYLPDYGGALQLQTIHPLFGLAWLGQGYILSALSLRPDASAPKRSRGTWLLVALAVLAVAVIPITLWRQSSLRFLATEPLAARLTDYANAPVAANLLAWISRDGLSLALVATLLPLASLILAAWLLLRKSTVAPDRAGLALLAGPVVVSLILAGLRMRWWNVVDGVLLVLLVALAASRLPQLKKPRGPWIWSAGLLVTLLPSLLLVRAPAGSPRQNPVNEVEIESLIERDLSHWLAKQVGPANAVVLTAPGLSTSLYFHGGLRTLGTPYPENKDGLAAAIRISGATSPDEGLALSRRRQLTHIILLSWDGFLDEYARLGSGQTENSLIALLHRFLAPRWLRPVPYHLPVIGGFEGQFVSIFQVVDVQDNTLALSRLAEYFVEMDQPDRAAAVSVALERSAPNDIGAMVARCIVQNALSEPEAFSRVFTSLLQSLQSGPPELPFDRGVSLAIALAEGKQYDLARSQLARCLQQMDAPGLRSLTTTSLYRLQLMSKALQVPFTDPKLQQLAHDLLPLELCDKV